MYSLNHRKEYCFLESAVNIVRNNAKIQQKYESSSIFIGYLQFKNEPSSSSPPPPPPSLHRIEVGPNSISCYILIKLLT
jgi:hypothetical protein